MTTWLVLLAGMALLVLVGIWLVGVANRLDRLHVRTDAAWAALDAALARRAVVARAVSGGIDPTPGDRLRVLADRAERAARPDREPAENALTRELAAVDRRGLPLTLVAELGDAEHRVVIARRVHGDAVRDTLALRRRRPVRWFKLAGTAPTPEYLEIAEPSLTEDVPRPAARVVLLNADGQVLLFHGHDPARADEHYWFTPGGGVEPGEDLRSAALRELREETGMALPPDSLAGPVWRRRVAFSFGGRSYDGEEWFYLAHVPEGSTVDTSGFTELEAATIAEHRWWSEPDLRTTGDTVYPGQLAELLADLRTWDGTLRTVR
ncbi:8-oxo-dGTP pyrophosphatase MutT (NUDIX family) [Actinokineospora baliensis]|uniref:NUDIX hydrolase n=1 Tax=Actinokineospora baliensis TaxID=547056 RepID=UPI00195BFC66|nr:NUDIX domain-containing protein [Actinokineospora baliensis]MBM7775926.1 8-oxo-dGTP pyrophosphatase MutT (NUDIX family) [Actinokineospora baliensis]